MLSPINYNPSVIKPIVAVVPTFLWIILWLSIGGGNAHDIINPSTLGEFSNGLRSIFPFVAGGAALVLILAKLPTPRPWSMLFIGPLGLAAVYGSVGILGVLVSPNSTTAISWTAAYLSVPLVLWSVTWGPDPLSKICQLINLTWAGLVLIAGILFVIALVYMDLGEVIRNPSGFFRCEDAGHWFTQTSGLLRSTGVGRYAALAAIVAFSGLWQKRFRWLWGLVFLGALMLITSTGARTSMLGLISAIGLIIILYGGRRAAIVGILGLAILISLHYLTGIGRVSVDECFIHKGLKNYTHDATDLILSVQPEAHTEDENDIPFPVAYDTGRIQFMETRIHGESIKGRSHVSAISNTASRDVSDQRVKMALNLELKELTNSHTDILALQVTPINTHNKLLISETRIANQISTLEESLDDSPTDVTFLNFSGRTTVWDEGIELVKDSPIIGHGFHADRMILEDHMHNAVLHALVQTGFAGTIPFLAAVFLTWFLILKALRNLPHLPGVQKNTIILMAALLAFLSVRAIGESTGAFFGVDWLLLALVFCYIQLVNYTIDHPDESLQTSSRTIESSPHSI